MRIKGKRIFAWILASVIALGCFTGVVENIINHFTTEKPYINIYSPITMRDAFSKAMSDSGVSSEYKGMIVDSPENADVLVEYGKEGDKDYTLFAYSPFVIMMSSDNGYYKQLKNTKLLTPSEYYEDNSELELMKIIDEVNGQGLWENLGMDDIGKIHLYYPAENTEYWHDFYNFMLLTVNGGTYPSSKYEMDSASKTVQKFLESSCTEGVTNYKEKITRTGGIPNNVIYIGPEQVLRYTVGKLHCNAFMALPKVTSNFNYYIKANSEIGAKLLDGMKSKFYSKLAEYYYRSERETSLNTKSDYISGLRNVFNSQQIPEENYFTKNFAEDNSEE